MLVNASFFLVKIIIFTAIAWGKNPWFYCIFTKLINGLGRFTSWMLVISYLVKKWKNILLTCIDRSSNSKTCKLCALLSMALTGASCPVSTLFFKQCMEHLEIFRGQQLESMAVYSCIVWKKNMERWGNSLEVREWNNALVLSVLERTSEAPVLQQRTFRWHNET